MSEHRIVVHGSASRSVPADRVRWALVIAEADTVPADAFERCSRRLDALTATLRDALGAEAEVRTGAVRVAPQRDDRGRPTERVDATGEVVVVVPLEGAGDAAGAAMRAGADHLQGPELLLRDERAIVAELTGEAVADARRKAASAAAAAERTLGRVVRVEEDDSGPIPVQRAGLMAAGRGPDLEPAEHELAVGVRVTFALDD